MLKNILLSDIDIDTSSKDYRRLLVANLSYIITIIVLSAFSLSNIFIRDNLLAGAIELIFIIPTVYGFFELRKYKNIDKSAMFANSLFFISMITVIFLFQFKEYVISWALLFPFITMNLCGAKKGIRFVIVFNIIIYVGGYYFWDNTDTTIVAYIRFITVSIIISTLVYFYEKSIASSFEKQQELNDSLIASVKEARKLAITDSLTTLYNKRHFDAILSEEFNRAKRADEPFILAIIDVDNFKLYNDTYGHDAGNLALERIGKILNQQTLRSGDYAFRIGGEEFAVILQASYSENIDNHFDNLRKKIEDAKIKHINNKPYKYLTASIGAVSVVNYENIIILDAYRKADKNLYAMKNNGRNSVLLSKI